LKRDPLLDDINRIRRHRTWRDRLVTLALVLFAVALALALLGDQ
jgi:hypothetical protein